MTIYDIDNATRTGDPAGSDRSPAGVVVVVTVAFPGAPDTGPQRRDDTPHAHR